MNWISKFGSVLDCIDERDDIDADFYVAVSGASEESLEQINISYPLIGKDYIEFLKKYDGADIAQCRLFGTSELKRAEDIYSDVYPKSKWFVFGENAGGDPILQNKDGEIFIGLGQTVNVEYQFLALSFFEFIDQVLMGENYPRAFWIEDTEFKGFINEEKGNDPWLDFLIEKKWLTI